MTNIYCPKGHVMRYEGFSPASNSNMFFCDDCFNFEGIFCLKSDRANKNYMELPSKTESQIAIDKVILALKNTLKFDDIEILTNLQLIEAVLNKLQELNK